jgi:hypothetical protein
MVNYWFVFVIELMATALVAGSVVRIVARLKCWSRRRIQLSAFFSYWLVYLLGVVLLSRSLGLHFLPHPFSDAGHTFGSDLFAFLLTVGLPQLAVQVALIGLAGPGRKTTAAPR